MNRALALLAGLLLVSQVAAQPVAAADANTTATTVLAQDQRTPAPPRTPAGLKPADTLSAVPVPDLKAELISGAGDGTERHSKFLITNAGSAVAQKADVRRQTMVHDESAPNTLKTDHDWIKIGDVAPGTSVLVEVHCKVPSGWYCDINSVYAKANGDFNTDNNGADDIVNP